MVNYEIIIYTKDRWTAETDDRVEIALRGNSQMTTLVILDKSLTHSDPFKRGPRDIFRIDLLDVGILQSIYISSMEGILGLVESIWFLIQE